MAQGRLTVNFKVSAPVDPRQQQDDTPPTGPPPMPGRGSMTLDSDSFPILPGGGIPAVDVVQANTQINALIGFVVVQIYRLKMVQGHIAAAGSSIAHQA
jgi:hypothetical protein